MGHILCQACQRFEPFAFLPLSGAHRPHTGDVNRNIEWPCNAISHQCDTEHLKQVLSLRSCWTHMRANSAITR